MLYYHLDIRNIKKVGLIIMIKNRQTFSLSLDLNQIINERRRVNNNIFKVEDEKHLPETFAEQNCKPTHEASFHVHISSHRAKRKDLISTALTIATSCTTVAQENIMDTISVRLGKIKDKEYRQIAKELSLKEDEIAEQINEFLCFYINGYEALHNKYCPKYYGL